MAAWVTVLDLKTDLNVDLTDTRDDVAYQDVLSAAVDFVERVRPGFNYGADPSSELPDPTEDLKLGTIRLATRWISRRKSPDGLIGMQELGQFRVPNVDPDIERLLGIGRYRGPVIA